MNKSGSAGTLTDTYHQDAYGNVLSNVNTGAWASSMSGRHLTTKEYDNEAYLYYFWQRWYDPRVGRFISPSLLPIDMEHAYSFAENNPFLRVDPFGLVPTVAPRVSHAAKSTIDPVKCKKAIQDFMDSYKKDGDCWRWAKHPHSGTACLACLNGYVNYLKECGLAEVAKKAGERAIAYCCDLDDLD